jgi:N-terminal half of MaoC dehydratase
MAERTHVTEAMRSVIGRPYGAMVSFPISASDIRRWALAVYYPEEPPRLYWDEDYARASIHGGIVAPDDFNPFAWMTAQPSGVRRRASSAADDLFEGKLGVPGPGLQFMLNGGLEVTYTGVRMRPGDVVRTASSIVGYREREGRLGLMLFTTMEAAWTNQRGELIKTQRSTLIRY